MTQNSQDIVKSYEQLLCACEGPNCDLVAVGQMLESLRYELTTISFLPSDNSLTSQQELLIARNILEVGANWSIETKNIPAFENYLSQLKHYYFDFNHQLPNSTDKYELLAVNLLRLLAQDKLAEFHRELDLLTPQEKTNDYIRYSVSMEQYLMAGCYNKVFLSKNNVPSPRFTVFMDILLETTRKEIADCIESSYESLPIKEVERMLFLSGEEDVRQFAQDRKWKCDENGVYEFHKDVRDGAEELPYRKVAVMMLEYAIDLDRIV